MSFTCQESVNFVVNDPKLSRNERRTFWVVCLTAVTMVVEIVAGYFTGSMALLADGYHMASHAGALTIAFITYRLAKSSTLTARFSFGAGKLIPLGGYTSAIVLALIACLMGFESIQRLVSPQSIRFDEAIGVAVIGLLVNILSAMILGDGHEHDPAKHENERGHEHQDKSHHVHDHNLRSAYLHVLADTLTSVLAIIALLLGKYFHWIWMDAAMGLVGSFVILKWAYKLCRDTGLELLDAHSPRIKFSEMKQLLLEHQAELLDLHAWRVAPNAVACEVVLSSQDNLNSAFYRDLIQARFTIHHLVIETRMHRAI